MLSSGAVRTLQLLVQFCLTWAQLRQGQEDWHDEDVERGDSRCQDFKGSQLDMRIPRALGIDILR